MSFLVNRNVVVDVSDADRNPAIAYDMQGNLTDADFEKVAIDQAADDKVKGRRPFTAKVRRGGGQVGTATAASVRPSDDPTAVATNESEGGDNEECSFPDGF